MSKGTAAGRKIEGANKSRARPSARSGADGRARWRLDAEALPLQIKTLPRQTEHRRGVLDAAFTLLQRVLHHRLLEVTDGGGHRLIEADDDLGRVEGAFGRRHRPARGRNLRRQVLGHQDRARFGEGLSLIHISEPTRLLSISYAVF